MSEIILAFFGVLLAVATYFLPNYIFKRKPQVKIEEISRESTPERETRSRNRRK